MTSPLPTFICPVLVGRRHPFDRVLDLAGEARAGKGQIGLITGEAGIGKSRLVSEVKSKLEEGGFLHLQGTCLETDRDVPFTPLIDLFRSLFLSRSPEAGQELIYPLAPELSRLFPELSAYLPDTLSAAPLEPFLEKRHFLQSLIHWFCRLADERPLLLVFEDLHWSDAATLEFLAGLLPQVPNHPVLVLLTYRSDELDPGIIRFLASLARVRSVHEFPLNRLDGLQVEEMVRALLQFRDKPRPKYLDTVYHLTEGNPLFVEEILKLWVNQGYISSTSGDWVRKPVTDLHVPRTVLVAVQQRTDGLSQPARQVLAVGAVAGRRFDFEIISQVTGLEEQVLLASLRELIQAQLVREKTPDVFVFQHALIREAVVADLLGRERRAYHRQIAVAMENRQVDSAADLAYHFQEAGDWEQVLVYAPQAAQKAQARFAPQAAVDLYSTALEAASYLSVLPAPALFRFRAQAYEALGEFEPAITDFETYLQLSRERGDFRDEWQALLDLGMLWAERDYRQTGDYIQQALALSRESKDPLLLAHSLNRLGNWLANSERPREAIALHQEALEIFEAAGDRPGLAETLDLLGTTIFHAGDLRLGSEYYRRAMELFRELDDLPGQISSLAMLSFRGGAPLNDTLIPAASLEEAWQDGERALGIARQTGLRSAEAFCLITLASCAASMGKAAVALRLGQEGLAIAREIGHLQWVAFGELILGSIYLDLMVYEQARQHLEQAFSLAQETQSQFWTKVAAGLLARAVFFSGDPGRSEAVLGSVLPGTVPEANSHPVGGDREAWCAVAELALARHQPEVAQGIGRVLRETALHSEEGKRASARLALLEGETLIAQRRFPEAEACLQAGLAEAHAQGAIPWLWRLHLALGISCRARRRSEEARGHFAQARTLIDKIAEDLEPDLSAQFQKKAAVRFPALPRLTPKKAAKQAFGGLTRQEREVAERVAKGKPNRMIADELFVTERTVEKHIEHILTKLDFSSRAQIAVWTVEREQAENRQA